MKTTSTERISSLCEAGHWGEDTLHSLLSDHACNQPAELAIRDQPNRADLTGDPPLSLTWSELDRSSSSLAAQLQNLGIGAGDKVVVQLPNIAELMVTYYALSILGVIVSPVPVQYSGHELSVIATVLKPRAMITIEEFRGGPMAESARALLGDIPVLVFGSDLVVDPHSSDEPETLPAVDANHVLSICWTSGTTGTPKGVPRSHNMWLATARSTIAAGNYQPDDILLNPFPLVNMAALGGFLFPAALLGCGIVLHHPLDPPLFLRQMQDEAITFTIAPPALLNQLAKSPELWEQFDFSNLRSIGSGSAPLSAWMIETFGREYGKEIVNFYGSNEGISLFSTPETAADPEVRANRFPQPAARSGSVTRVVDPETGQELYAAGERGELQIAGATVFDGYFEHDNVDVFSSDGFFLTGDLVEISGSDQVYYQIVGRCKDIINRGGMKISPAELDVVLEQHSDLVEGAVCAYEDERLGEKICACAVMREGSDALPLADIQAYFLEAGFAKFKLPERVEIFDALPRNPLGKVQRFSLQDQVAARIKEST